MNNELTLKLNLNSSQYRNRTGSDTANYPWTNIDLWTFLGPGNQVCKTSGPQAACDRGPLHI